MVSATRRVAVSLAALVVLGVGAETASGRAFDLEGHRGTRGLRPENTLAAFGKALQVGVTTLELDTGVTEDGVVVVCHERRHLDAGVPGTGTPATESRTSAS